MKPEHTIAALSERPAAAQIASNLIISVSEARKLLGADAQDLSDDELVLEIYELTEALRIVMSLAILQVRQ